MASKVSGVASLADRYATALFELADGEKALDVVSSDLTTLKGLIDESEDLRRLLRSPLIRREDQVRAVETILEKAGASDIVRRFVGVVARNRRLFALRAVIDAYLAMLAARRGEVIAEVTSARPLSKAQMDSATDALKKAVGARVKVEQRVDPALIGGLIVRVGSRMVDSSLRTKLQRLQFALKGIG